MSIDCDFISANAMTATKATKNVEMNASIRKFKSSEIVSHRKNAWAKANMVDVIQHTTKLVIHSHMNP